MKKTDLEKKKSSNIVKFGKNEMDISKLSDEELTELYEKMANKKISLVKKVLDLNDGELISAEDMKRILEII